MKKYLLFILCLITNVTYSQDVIVLKDGSTILSKVTEIDLEIIKYKKYNNLDGSTYTINSSDILSINYENGEKELFENRKQEKNRYTKHTISKEIKKGYHAFIDLGYTIGKGDFPEKRIDFTTSHGFRPNENFFVGAGGGVSFWHDINSWSIPIFFNLRCDIPTKEIISPYFDVKAGYSVFDQKGFYGNYSIGCRLTISNRSAITISIGYQMQKCLVKDHWVNRRISRNGLNAKVGLEF